MYKANDVARMTTEMYLSDMQPAMTPASAFAKMAHREIDRVAIDDLEGRITSVLLKNELAGFTVIPVRLVQSKNAAYPMLLTLLPIVMLDTPGEYVNA